MLSTSHSDPEPALRARSRLAAGAPAADRCGRRAEAALALGVAVLVALALLLPAVPLAAGYNAFADVRPWLGIPNASNVLSNLAYVVMGVWGLVELRAARRSLGAAQTWLAAVFLIGLVMTGGTSAFYHWAPGDARLAVDRLGMCVAFAGILGLAVADRISVRAGVALALFVAVAAPLAVWVAYARDDMTAWIVLQVGGLALLAMLALLRPRRGAVAFSLLGVIAIYVLAKVAEVGDVVVLEQTHRFISGHAAKHVASALAAWPVVLALRRRSLESA